MPLKQLTLLGALDSLRYECAGALLGETGVRRGALKVLKGGWIGAVVLVAGLAGCAAISVNSAPEEKTKYVAQRAEARWQLLIKGDLDGAYQYLSAGSKAATSLEVYKSKIKPGMWREAKTERVDCKGEICDVLLQITYDARRMKGIQTPLTESWILENGSAWYIYR